MLFEQSCLAAHLVSMKFRAIAMLKLIPDNQLIDDIIAFVSVPNLNYMAFWVVAAAPGWSGENINAFLNECLKSDKKETVRAAEAALKNKYLKWNPL